MKKIKLFLYITLFLIGGSVIHASAQSRDHNTSGARAAYGLSPKQSKHKKSKKKHKSEDPSVKLTKAAREKKRAFRKRNNWAS
jgi:hypothetical protein